MGRLIAAVAVGFILWSVLWIGAGWVVTNAFPDSFSDGDQVTDNVVVLLLLIVVSFGISIIAGWTTGWLARASAEKAPWVLGLVLLAVGIWVESATWSQTPIWYHVFFLALLVPGVLIGARLTKPRQVS